MSRVGKMMTGVKETGRARVGEMSVRCEGLDGK